MKPESDKPLWCKKIMDGVSSLLVGKKIVDVGWQDEINIMFLTLESGERVLVEPCFGPHYQRTGEPFPETYTGLLVCSLSSSLYSSNVYVLPPGQGRAAGVDVVGFMPVGRDVLFDFFDGSVSQDQQAHPARRLTWSRAKS